ncbi:hypothetical protein FJZ55_07645 [Candidatus Woesearchaeota archaeon]|nr:hypothetical protein [Candidatus Woesearchaeota archaeon]
MPFGITLLAYAVLGSLMMLLTVGLAFTAPMLMKLAAPGGEPPRTPMVLLVLVAVGGAISVGLGVLLGLGGLGVLAHRRIGIARVKRWAVLRLTVAALSLIISWLLLPTQVEHNRLTHDWQIAASNDPRVREVLGEFDPAANRRLTLIVQVVGSFAVSIVPFATLIYLSRASVQRQVDRWD